jgi:hypothetical protein
MVTGMTTAAEAALDALRRWAATNRADLVAAAWHAGNTNITELANAAGRGRDVIYADLRARNIDPKTDRTENPPVPTLTPTLAPGWTDYDVPGWRHPHLLWVQARTQQDGGYAGRVAEWKFGTKPFTGAEPEPEIPQEWRDVHPTDSDLPEGDYGRWAKYNQRNQEIRLVKRVWAQARFDHQVIQRIQSPFQYSRKTVVDMWNDYVTARDALAAAYTALDTTADNEWRMAVLRIIDAKKPARTAAANWDSIAAEFAELDEWLLRQLGEEDHPMRAVVDAAKKDGIDASAWLIGSAYDYKSDYGRTPACDQIHDIIEKGDARIKEVERLLARS